MHLVHQRKPLFVKSYAAEGAAATETEVAVKIPVTVAPDVLGETLCVPSESRRSPLTLPVRSPKNSDAVTIPVILILPDPVISLTSILGVPVSPCALMDVVAVPVRSPVTFIVPCVATKLLAVTIPETLMLSPVNAPATFRESRVPTEVSEELTTPDPSVVELRTSVLSIL